jgi:hypothetical protein
MPKSRIHDSETKAQASHRFALARFRSPIFNLWMQVSIGSSILEVTKIMSLKGARQRIRLCVGFESLKTNPTPGCESSGAHRKFGCSAQE